MKVENDNLFHKGSPMPEAYALYFSGQAYLNPLTKSLNIANVTFEPGCRNNWHIHHKGGQILLVTAGRGWYQAWGETARELHPGDAVCAPRVDPRSLLNVAWPPRSAILGPCSVQHRLPDPAVWWRSLLRIFE